MAWHEKSLGELLEQLHKEFGEHRYGRIDLDVTSTQKEKAMAWFSNGVDKLLDWPVARRENLDGVKLYLGDEGWVMVRASGTENLLRVYAETSRIETTRKVLGAVAERIQRF
jgi:phosphomannomutase